MSDVDDIINEASKHLNDSYEDERPAVAPSADEDVVVSRLEAAHNELILAIARGKPMTTSIFILEDDPHIQKFRCSLGHLQGAVTSFQRVLIVKVSATETECLVCGERVKIPYYEPVGDEPADILAALREARELDNGEAPTDY